MSAELFWPAARSPQGITAIEGIPPDRAAVEQTVESFAVNNEIRGR